ncbi:MAG: hypothetical protein L0212_03830 [Acidobacteria bacterium]|nr:hypothetical protein [Acidobacteriota bacterium]
MKRLLKVGAGIALLVVGVLLCVTNPTLSFALPVFGVVTVTQLFRDNDMVEYGVEATADADTTTGNIVHLMGPAPVVTLLPSAAAARISLWILGVADNTNVTALKATTAGSGAAGEQVRVRVERRRR